MTKKDITIGILDADNKFSKKIKEATEKEGYTAIVYSDHESLIANMKLRKFDVLIIECLTQKVSLPNLVDTLLAQVANPPVFIFVSLVLDKSSVQPTLKKVNPSHFFKKPVVESELIKLINESFKDLVSEEEKDPFLDLIYANQFTNQEKIKVLTSVQSLNGNEVPRYISTLLRTQFTGEVKFNKAEGKKFSVFLSKGSITRVDVDDPKSFFGALLVDKNFVTIEELELTLQKKSSKRIGERLVEANLISPHVIDIVNTEQLGIRLGYLVQNTNYEVEAKSSDVRIENTWADINSFQRFFSDWLNSKIEMKWLKMFFVPLLDSKINKSASYQDLSPLYQLEPLSRMPKFNQKVISDTTIGSIIESKSYSEEDVYQAIYLLLSLDYINFDKALQKTDTTHNVDRLKKIKEDMDSQNHFEVLGLNDKAKSKEIKKNYYELSKIFHPDKVSSSKNEEVKNLTQYIFAKISKAYEVLSDELQKASYVKELEKGNAEKILESESLFDEAKSYLKSNQASKALPLLEKALSLRPPTSELKLYFLWTQLQLIPNSNVEEYLKNIEMNLNKVAPEDRHNSTYYFVKGLYAKALGDYAVAEKHFKHALSMQTGFFEAQREINIIALQKKGNKQVDILNADLKDVVGLLFKKKK